MNAEPLPPSPSVFSDRRAGLIVFGVLEILIGCFCALLIPLMVVGIAVGAKATGTPPDNNAIVPGVVVYGLAAIAFVWLGVGSIMCRRWARALLLVFSWSWLLVGVMVAGFSVALMPRVFETVQAGPGKAGIIFMFVFLGIILLVIPGVLTCFYQGRNVKATCEVRDPVRRWTDACPLPVLAAALWLGLGALCMLPMPLAHKSVLPFFGTLLTGLPAMLFYVVWAAGSLWLAWAFYRLMPAAWWIAVVAFLLFSVSNSITFAQIDIMEMYRLMGYPQRQLEEMQKFNFFSGKDMAVWTACCMAPWLGYLLWIKKFFRRFV
ncbi:MAG: hypothetical protein HZC54_14710 [Verrucomicrobia bacterium]|nr:hypothetical protein [Verrucomicrobiota bacterium]